MISCEQTADSSHRWLELIKEVGSNNFINIPGSQQIWKIWVLTQHVDTVNNQSYKIGVKPVRGSIPEGVQKEAARTLTASVQVWSGLIWSLSRICPGESLHTGDRICSFYRCFAEISLFWSTLRNNLRNVSFEFSSAFCVCKFSIFL